MWGSWRQAENDADLLMFYTGRIWEPKLSWERLEFWDANTMSLLSKALCSPNILTWLLVAAVEALLLGDFLFFVVGSHSLFSLCLETPWIPEYYLVPWKAGAVDLILIFFFLAIKSCFILPASTESGLLCVSVFEKRGLWVQSTPGCGRLKGYCFILCRKHVQSQGGENSPLIKRHGTGGLPKSKSSWKDEPFVPEALT